MKGLIDFGYMVDVSKSLIKYLPETLRISCLSMVFAVILAVPVAAVQIRRVPVLRRVAGAYVLVSRACPLMIQIYLVYFGVPLFMLWLRESFGLDVNMAAVRPAALGVAALSLNFAAYISQTLRFALLSVDKGQMEACLSVGMTWLQGFRRIVLVQASAYALPPMTGQFLNLIKGTSILFTISVEELTAGGKIEAALSYRYLEIYLVIALIYWVISIAVENMTRLASKRLGRFLKG